MRKRMSQRPIGWGENRFVFKGIKEDDGRGGKRV